MLAGCGGIVVRDAGGTTNAGAGGASVTSSAPGKGASTAMGSASSSGTGGAGGACPVAEGHPFACGNDTCDSATQYCSVVVMNQAPGCPPDFHACLPIPASCQCDVASCYAGCVIANGEITCTGSMAC
jgi:hypothetical protein